MKRLIFLLFCFAVYLFPLRAQTALVTATHIKAVSKFTLGAVSVTSISASTDFSGATNLQFATRLAVKDWAENLVSTTAAGKQPLNSSLTSIAGLALVNDRIMQVKAGAWSAQTPAAFKTDLALVKADVGLGNVDNTTDAGKPISTATATALTGKQAADSDLTDIAALAPVDGKIIKRVGGVWTAADDATAGGGGAVTSVNGATGTVVLTKSDIGLGNVDNTSDANKPISTATATALSGKQPTLTAGSGIAIVGSTISATGGGGSTMTDYSAGSTGTSSCRVRASGTGVTFARTTNGSSQSVLTISIPTGVFLYSFRIYTTDGALTATTFLVLDYTGNNTTNQDIATMDPPDITGIKIGASVHNYVPGGLSGAVNLNTRVSAISAGDLTLEFSALTTSLSTGATMIMGKL